MTCAAAVWKEVSAVAVSDSQTRGLKISFSFGFQAAGFRPEEAVMINDGGTFLISLPLEDGTPPD